MGKINFCVDRLAVEQKMEDIMVKTKVAAVQDSMNSFGVPIREIGMPQLKGQWVPKTEAVSNILKNPQIQVNSEKLTVKNSNNELVVVGGEFNFNGMVTPLGTSSQLMSEEAEQDLTLNLFTVKDFDIQIRINGALVIKNNQISFQYSPNLVDISFDKFAPLTNTKFTFQIKKDGTICSLTAKPTHHQDAREITTNDLTLISQWVTRLLDQRMNGAYKNYIREGKELDTLVALQAAFLKLEASSVDHV